MELPTANVNDHFDKNNSGVQESENRQIKVTRIANDFAASDEEIEFLLENLSDINQTNSQDFQNVSVQNLAEKQTESASDWTSAPLEQTVEQPNLF